MKPERLHQLWELIETIQTNRLLRLKQKSLADLLIQKLKAQQDLSLDEEAEVRDYVDARLPLIHELAQRRQETYCLLPACT